MPDTVITSCPPKPPKETTLIPGAHQYSHNLPIPDDGGNQSDSSNSNSSLLSSPRYNERHPRVLESVRKKSSGRVYYGSGGCATSLAGGNSSRGSFVMIGSRTSLPPLDENNTLDGTESQLALNLRRATRSTSWTNQKILDTIDGLNTCVQELDPCLALGGKASSTGEEKDDGTSKNGSPRQSSFEKFVLPKSISNLIMKSRSSGSVNPPTSNQNRENSCYNFLSGIREDEDEEQQLPQETNHSTNGKPCPGGGIRLTITSTSIPTSVPPAPPQEEAKRRSVTGGVERKDNDDLFALSTPNNSDKIGAPPPQQSCSKNGNVNRIEMENKTGTHHHHPPHHHHEQNKDLPENVRASDVVPIAQMESSSIRPHQHHHHHHQSQHHPQPNHNERSASPSAHSKGEQQKPADVHHSHPARPHLHQENPLEKGKEDNGSPPPSKK